MQSPPEENSKNNNMINIEEHYNMPGAQQQALRDDKSGSESSSELHNMNDPDAAYDHKIKKFLAGLQEVGPMSKQILNYSYPPLLYQRGDDSEEGEGEEAGVGEADFDDDDDPSRNQFPLDDDDFNVGDLLGRDLGLDDID